MVSTVEIDGSTGTVTKSENTNVDAVVRQDTLEWTQTDHALPMPLETDDETIRLALRYSDFIDALNRETLKVTGLPSGRYNLQIDDEAVGAFDATSLASGINLSALKTPMTRQAQTVLDLTYRRNHLRFARMMMVDNALKDYLSGDSFARPWTRSNRWKRKCLAPKESGVAETAPLPHSAPGFPFTQPAFAMKAGAAHSLS